MSDEDILTPKHEPSPTTVLSRPEEATVIEPDSKRVKTDAAPEAAVPASAPDGIKLSELGLAAGKRVEVAWEVEMTDDTEETVWWGAVLTVPEKDAATAGAAILTYDARDSFPEETRRVVFSSPSLVWDTALSEGLKWRVEGGECAEEPEEAEEAAAADDDELPIGSAVKARFQGGEVWHAGTVAAHNEDGTLDVLYEDRTLEQGIPRELVQGVALSREVAAALAAGDSAPTPVVEGIDSFFEMFVSALTSGATFQRLDPAKQAVASEKVRAMRPAFEAELGALRDERGHGATVTGEDIKAIVPRIMKRQAEAAAAAAAAAAQ